ncbi:MAG: peptidoglycan-associated lipoprotein Pal [bacterium]|nr:peptidoglycan-associated lipoprotein Pal [bacterium]
MKREIYLMAIIFFAVTSFYSCAPKAVKKAEVKAPAPEEKGPQVLPPPTPEAKPEKKVEEVKKPEVAKSEEQIREEGIREREARAREAAKKAEEARAREAAKPSEKPFSLKEVKIPFDFDSFVLSTEAKDYLDTIASFLMKNPSIKIQIEGHTDERGTNEYNLALGQRRADSARKYLEDLGVSPKRIATLSYGEERPLDDGHNEEAWAKNRRAEFIEK